VPRAGSDPYFSLSSCFSSSSPIEFVCPAPGHLFPFFRSFGHFSSEFSNDSPPPYLFHRNRLLRTPRSLFPLWHIGQSNVPRPLRTSIFLSFFSLHGSPKNHLLRKVDADSLSFAHPLCFPASLSNQPSFVSPITSVLTLHRPA